MRIALTVLLMLILTACAVRERASAIYEPIASGNLPVTDVTLSIPGLSTCTDNPDHRLHLKVDQPVYVLVHGCFGSSGQFRGLAQVLAFHGQQTVCFSYDDRARLSTVAAELRRAINLLGDQLRAPRITIIGHSQGALIAHKALTEGMPMLAYRPDWRLVTISGPFGGIAAAKTCGRTWLYPVTLGLLPLSCYAVTGAKWQDITDSSRFIRAPGTLAPEVSQFLKIDTDERGVCASGASIHCSSRVVFSLAEQRNAALELDGRARRVQVRAGHVEIVGDKSVAPLKLIAILQEQGAIPPTAPERVTAFNQLLASIFGADRNLVHSP